MNLLDYLEFRKWDNWFYLILSQNGYVPSVGNFIEITLANPDIIFPTLNISKLNRDFSIVERSRMISILRTEMLRIIGNIKINFPEDLEKR